MNREKIEKIIVNTADSFQPDEEVAAFIGAFKEKYGDNLEGVIFYGSCLVAKMRKPTSILDFFLLLRDYEAAARNLMDRLLLPLLPPNSYFMKIPHGGRTLENKYLLLTLRDFRRISTHHAADHFVAGRMSKRSVIAWSKDATARQMMLDSMVDAFLTNAFLTAPLIMEPVDFKGLVISFLRTSYLSELRLELPDKIEQIYLAEKELYDKLYGLLAEDLVESGMLSLRKGMYRSSAGGTWQARKVKLYLMKSKARHIMRFPKIVRNMDNWIGELLGKFERTYGIKLELSDWEKRHDFLTAVKYFYKIKIAKNFP